MKDMIVQVFLETSILASKQGWWSISENEERKETTRRFWKVCFMKNTENCRNFWSFNNVQAGWPATETESLWGRRVALWGSINTLYLSLFVFAARATHIITSIAGTWQESWEPSATLGTWKCLGNTRRTYHENIIQILYTIEIQPPKNAPDFYSKIQTPTSTSRREKDLNFWSSSRSCCSGRRPLPFLAQHWIRRCFHVGQPWGALDAMENPYII